MPKKARRTKWRKLSLGDSSGPDDEEDEGVVMSGDGTWRETPPYLRSSSGGSGPGSLSPDILRDGKRVPRYWNARDGYTCPVRTQCKTFGNEEYTIISTPRQEVLFKKGSIAKKKPEQIDTRPPSSQTGEDSQNHENGVAQSHDGTGFEEGSEPHLDHHQPFMCYPVSYDMYGNVVGPYVPYGSQYPVLPTVMLQPMQWYDRPPGEQVYYYALMYPTPVIPEGAIAEEGKIIEEDEEDEHEESCCRRGSLSSQACCSNSLPDQDLASISSPGTSQGPSSPQAGLGTPSTEPVSPQPPLPPQGFVPLADFARLTCNVSVPPPPIVERTQVEAPPPPPQAGYVHPSYKIGPPPVYTVAQKPSTLTRHRSPPVVILQPPKRQEPRPPLPPGLTRRQRRNRKKRRELEEEWEMDPGLPSVPDIEVTSSQLESQTANQNSSSPVGDLKSDEYEVELSESHVVFADEQSSESPRAESPISEPEIFVVPDPVSEPEIIVTEVEEALEVEPEVIEDEPEMEVESECEEEAQSPVPVFELDLPDGLPFDPAELEHLSLDSPLEGWGCVDLGLPKKQIQPVLLNSKIETKSNHFLGYAEQGDAITPCSYATEKSCSTISAGQNVFSKREIRPVNSGSETMVVPISLTLPAESLSDHLSELKLEKHVVQEAVPEVFQIEVKSEFNVCPRLEENPAAGSSTTETSDPALCQDVPVCHVTIELDSNLDFLNGNAAPGVEMNTKSLSPNLSKLDSDNGNLLCEKDIDTVAIVTASFTPEQSGCNEPRILPSQQSFPESQLLSLVRDISCDQSPPESFSVPPTFRDQEKAQLGENVSSAPPLSNLNDNHVPDSHVVDDSYKFGSASGTPYHSLFATPIKGEIERENLNLIERMDSLDESDSLEKSKRDEEGSTSTNVSSLSASFEADSLEDKDEISSEDKDCEDFGEEVDEEFHYQKTKPLHTQIWKTVILEETETETSESDNDRIRTYSDDTESDEILRIELPEEAPADGSFYLLDGAPEEFLEVSDLISGCELEPVMSSNQIVEKGVITEAVSKWLSTVPSEERVVTVESDSDSESEFEHAKNGLSDPRTAPSHEEDGPQRRVDEIEEIITPANCSPTRYSQYYQLGVVMSDEEAELGSSHEQTPGPVMTDSGCHTDASSTESEKATPKTNSLRKRLKSTLKRGSWRRNSKAICAEISRDEVAFERVKRGQHCCSLQ